MKKNNIRVFIVAITFLGLFLTLAGRLIWIQVFQKTEILSTVRAFTKIRKLRGNIKTADGKTIASSIRGKRLFLKKPRYEMLNTLLNTVNALAWPNPWPVTPSGRYEGIPQFPPETLI